MTSFDEIRSEFREANRRYAELKRRHKAGEISTCEFDRRLKDIMVQDDKDRWWSKSRKTGQWHYYDGEDWVRGTPPGGEPDPEPPTTLPKDPHPGGADGAAPEEERVRVPNLSGKFHSQVKDLLDKAGLRQTRTTNRSGAPRDTVILQHPAVGTEMDRGGTVMVTYSAGLGRAWLWFLVIGGVVISIILVAALSSGSGGDFEDDFSSTSSGWLDETLSDVSSVGYGSGTYVISAPESRFTFATAPAGTFEDVTVETRVTDWAGDSDSVSGVICRAEDSENYYVMGHDAVDFAFISKVEDGELVGLETGTGDFFVDDTIGGDCIGGTLTLYVDGEQALETTDYSFQSGEVGLWVRDGGNDPSDTEVNFGDFSASPVE